FDHSGKPRRERRLLHRVTDAVAHEPGRLVGDLERTVKLVGAHALLGRADQVEGPEPLVQRDVTRLEDRPHSHGELLAALGTLPEPPRLVRQLVVLLVIAAMRADRAVRPADRL